MSIGVDLIYTKVMHGEIKRNLMNNFTVLYCFSSASNQRAQKVFSERRKSFRSAESVFGVQ